MPLNVMLLHTPNYFLFLFAVALSYWIIPWPSGKKGVLIVSSYFFYAMIDWRFAGLLFSLSVVVYLTGKAIATSQHANRWVWLGILVNLGVLGFFKYGNFFLNSLTSGLNYIGVKTSSAGLSLLLPVGISFYTFQAVSYIIEIYRKKLEPAASFMDFTLYLVFFPKLIAGPIVRPGNFMNQLKASPQRLNLERLQPILSLLLLGLVKKLWIADSLASLGEAAFRAAALPGNAAGFNTPIFLQGFYLYAFQIYADFSGYTDIARASAKLLGYELPENFQQPYLSSSLTTFWNRWHMSLTQWFREYLYFPLSRSLLIKIGRRRSRLIQICANLVTMSLIGLWHGAAWTFVAWGLWHGILLSLENLFNLKQPQRWIQVLKGIITFHLVGIGWVLFRAESFKIAWNFLRGLISLNNMGWITYYLPSILLTASLIFAIDLVAGGKLSLSSNLWKPSKPVLTIAALVVIVSITLLGLAHGLDARPFIYGLF